VKRLSSAGVGVRVVLVVEWVVQNELSHLVGVGQVIHWIALALAHERHCAPRLIAVCVRTRTRTRTSA
jgi:hypothetical protein